MTTRIQKWGNSQGVRISKEILDTVNWNENEEILVFVKGGRIILEKSKKKKNIKELFADYDEKYEPEEIDWGEPQGDEVW